MKENLMGLSQAVLRGITENTSIEDVVRILKICLRILTGCSVWSDRGSAGISCENKKSKVSE